METPIEANEKLKKEIEVILEKHNIVNPLLETEIRLLIIKKQGEIIKHLSAK